MWWTILIIIFWVDIILFLIILGGILIKYL
jgi:hypothetical protein